MRRLTLQQLRAERCASSLRGLVRERFIDQRAALAAALLPPQLDRARLRIEESLAAAASLEPSEALAAAERGAGGAVELMRELPTRIRLGQPAQHLLRHTFGSLIAQRVAVWRALELQAEPSELTSAGPEEGSTRSAGASELITEDRYTVGELVAMAVEDSRAFAREKFGDAPEVESDRSFGERSVGERSVGERSVGDGVGSSDAATKDSDLPRLLLPQYVTFAAIELLKNALGAHVRRFFLSFDPFLPYVGAHSPHISPFFNSSRGSRWTCGRRASPST